MQLLREAPIVLLVRPLPCLLELGRYWLLFGKTGLHWKALRAPRSHPQENPARGLHSIFHGPKMFSNKTLALPLADLSWLTI